jgi:hypothetical protein
MSHVRAAALPPRLLSIAVIKPSLFATLMLLGSGAELISTSVLLAAARAVAVASVTATAKKEDLAALATDDEP